MGPTFILKDGKPSYKTNEKKMWCSYQIEAAYICERLQISVEWSIFSHHFSKLLTTACIDTKQSNKHRWLQSLGEIALSVNIISSNSDKSKPNPKNSLEVTNKNKQMEITKIETAQNVEKAISITTEEWTSDTISITCELQETYWKHHTRQTQYKISTDIKRTLQETPPE